MLRTSELTIWSLRGAAVFVACWLVALSATPAGAQQAAAAEAQADAIGDDEAEDDDLLQPSNTGYIDDAIVASKLRLRFDSATNAGKADRAEFFYGKCLCFSKFFGQEAASPGPATDLDFQEVELNLEHAFSKRFSLFVEIPYRRVDITEFIAGQEPQFNIAKVWKGLGDLRAGMKYALIAEADRYVTFQLRGYFASGNAAKALGTDHASIEPGFLYFSRPSERVTFASEVRWWHPLSGSSDPVSGSSGGTLIRQEGVGVGDDGLPNTGDETPARDPAVRNDGFAGDVLRFGFGASWEGRGERISVSPVAELVGWYVIDGYKTFDTIPGAEFNVEEANNDTIVNLKLGARISGRGPGSVYLGYGFPLSNEEWYGGIFRFEYRLPLAASKRHKAKMAAARAAEERQAAARAAEARAAAEAEVRRAAAETAAREAEAQRAAAEAAAAEAEARRAAAEAAAQAAEAQRAAAEAARQAAAAQRAKAPGHRVAAAATPCLNLRPEPTTAASRLHCLEPGTPVTVLEPGDEWSRIRAAGGSEGWVVSRALEPIGG